MTGSWTIDAFIIGSVILICLPAVVCLYEDVFKNKGSETK